MATTTTMTSGLRILVTNDDGIHARGLKVLERIAKDLSPDAWVVAPQGDSSGRSSSVTFNDPFKVQEVSPRRFAVGGTPVDCVIFALKHLLASRPPDLILSGVNAGTNTGDISVVSGTLGAAMVGALQGVKSIGVSLDTSQELSQKYTAVEHFLPTIVRKLLAVAWPERTVMSVNFPDVPVSGVSGIKPVPLSTMPLQWRVDPREDPYGDPYYWLTGLWTDAQIAAQPRSDLYALHRESAITVTPIRSYAASEEGLRVLEEVFASHVP